MNTLPFTVPDDNNSPNIQEKNSPYIGGVNPMFGQNPPPGPGAGPGPGGAPGPTGGGFHDMGGPGGAPGSRAAPSMSANPTGTLIT